MSSNAKYIQIKYYKANKLLRYRSLNQPKIFKSKIIIKSLSNKNKPTLNYKRNLNYNCLINNTCHNCQNSNMFYNCLINNMCPLFS